MKRLVLILVCLLVLILPILLLKYSEFYSNSNDKVDINTVNTTVNTVNTVNTVEQIVNSNISNPNMSLKPHFTETDQKLFDKYLEKSKRYFEFGSGNSTIYVASKPHITFLGSIENEQNWYNQTKTNLKNVQRSSELELIYNYIHTHSDGMPWGNPRKVDSIAFKNYYSSYKPEYNADLILIDGRFRVSCCLDLYHKIGMDTVIFFDDFLNRPYYHDILQYFDIIESGNVAVVLKKKLNRLEGIQSLKEQYATVSR